MAGAKTLEDIIAEQAPIVREQIETAVSFAESEEYLRIEFKRAIEVFRKEADLPKLKGHHEVTIGKGRVDSVYDYVFIEYKKPGRLKQLNESPGNREVSRNLIIPASMATAWHWLAIMKHGMVRRAIDAV